MAQCLPPDICYLCLSRDRKIFCLSANIRHLFGFLTDYYPQTDARVCWECRATLERLHKFKVQAKQAVSALERARTGLQPMSFECLSKVYGTQMLLIDLLVHDDANVIATNDLSVDISKNKICKVEVEFEDDNPKIKAEILEELDLGANTISENTPDHIAEDDNDVGTKGFVTIDWTGHNTETVIQHDTEEINVPQTKFRIVAPSSSAEGEITSKDVKNARGIKKRQGVVKPKIKLKKPMVRRIRKNLTTAKKLIDKERLAEEQKYKMHQQGKAFECDHCGKKFERRGKIRSHMKVHFKKVICDQCAYRCHNQATLRKHMLAHLDPSHRPQECEVCHKRFIDKYKLRIHTRSHTGERPFKCDICDMAFTCKEALTCHIKERHTDRATSVKKRFSQPRTKSFYVNPRHHHSNDSEVTRHKRNYTVMNYDERPYQCNICGARSMSKQHLQVHVSSHSNDKPFKCNECSATFKSQSGLWSHKLIHKGEKRHQCSICEARFTIKSNLVGHMKVHTKDRPFECDICGKKFPWKRNLNNHIKIHSKEQQ